jgi:hypothetical protein
MQLGHESAAQARPSGQKMRSRPEIFGPGGRILFDARCVSYGLTRTLIMLAFETGRPNNTLVYTGFGNLLETFWLIFFGFSVLRFCWSNFWLFAFFLVGFSETFLKCFFNFF